MRRQRWRRGSFSSIARRKPAARPVLPSFSAPWALRISAADLAGAVDSASCFSAHAFRSCLAICSSLGSRRGGGFFRQLSLPLRLGRRIGCGQLSRGLGGDLAQMLGNHLARTVNRFLDFLPERPARHPLPPRSSEPVLLQRWRKQGIVGSVTVALDAVEAAAISASSSSR